MCRNLNLHGCTWLAPLEGGQCFSCDLTRTRPSDEDLVGLENYPAAERAKRHLVAELDTLGFRVVGKDPETGGDPEDGLAFDLLSSVAGQQGNVVIGHEDGVITIDLAESDAAYREQVKQKLAEPYRTMLGHFRHEVGHYYEWQLVRGEDRLTRCRELFGDESPRLPGRHRPALPRRAAGGVGGVLHQHLRDHAPVRGLRRDLGALPAHLRHRRDRLGVRPHRGRRR